MIKEYDFKPNTVLGVLIFVLSIVSVVIFYLMNEVTLAIIFGIISLFGIHLIYTRFTKELKVVITDEQIVIPTSIGKMITIKFDYITEVVETSQRGFVMLNIYQGKIPNAISPSFLSASDYEEIKQILLSKVPD